AVVAVAAALLIAVVVVRNAFVAQFAEVRPQRALAAWPGHPQAELWSGLTGIAAATRAGRPVSPATLAMLMDAARKSPLAAEPFLVRGVQGRLAGNESLAGKAFLAAELRDGRSVPARYFLADHDLRSGDARDGLRQIAVLARMIPNGVVALSPFVASYAQDPRNWPQLRALFQSNPNLGDSALSALAADPRNADLVLRLAPRTGAQGLWANRLVQTLVTAGDYAKAGQVWRRVNDVSGPPGALIYDSGFTDATAPGPFNWTLTSSPLGLAERRGGRLHVIYYGQDDGVLASQLLLLEPGRYRLAMQATGDVAGLLSWTVTCADSSAQLLKLAVASRTDGSFTVPAGCTAQRLELAGSAPELPRTVDVTIGGLSLQREPARG
ncbi:MAG TPA: hypothetical protein VN106_08580, partial [Sphingomicrobium sp.]|nr:hypothetical protein [Sphingomicrobium sp.]